MDEDEDEVTQHPLSPFDNSGIDDGFLEPRIATDGEDKVDSRPGSHENGKDSPPHDRTSHSSFPFAPGLNPNVVRKFFIF